jgi:C-terminal processing protease CtpA/Prc
MRRFKALLIAAGLAAAPASAAAHPCPQSPDHTAFEKFEWSTSKGRLGVFVMSLTPELRKHFGAAEDRGVMVARVEPLSPAAAAGIKPGDILTEVKGRTIAEAGDVISALADVPKDQSVSIKLVRDGKTLDISAKLMSDATSWLDPSWTMGWLHDLFKHFPPPTTNPNST